MSALLQSEDRFRRAFLLLLVISISAAFLAMIRSFLLTILVAAIFTGLFYPLYLRLLALVGGRRPAAAALTVLLGLVLVVGPLATVVGLVTNEALRVSEAVRPWVREFVEQPSALQHILERLPFYDRIQPYNAQILERGGELVGNFGRFFVSSLSNTTRVTVAFLFDFFIFLYTMFFLLMDGPDMLRAIMRLLPLSDGEKAQMLDKFVSVSRATLRGTLVIGVIQGSLAGLAFWVVGIQGALFWATIMIVLSVLPLVGGALVWVPAAIFLAVAGYWGQAIGLALFCALVVGSVDNVLRPRLVGRDTKMHDLLILFSTLGGIIGFGPIGFIVGPVLAALFLTSWEIFGVAYRDVLRNGTPPVALPEGGAVLADVEVPEVEMPRRQVSDA